MTELNSVEIKRIGTRVVEVTWSGSGWSFNSADAFIQRKHEGVWDSLHMRFAPPLGESFSDGTPVAIYESLETLEDA